MIATEKVISKAIETPVLEKPQVAHPLDLGGILRLIIPLSALWYPEFNGLYICTNI